MVIRACRQGFVCQHKCVWNHVETPALKPGLLIWNSRAGSLGAITSRFSGRAAASTPSRCREVSDRRMPHGRPGFCRRAVRTRLAAGGKWIRTLRSAAKGESVPWCDTRVLATLEAIVSFCRMTKIAAPMTGDRGFESTSLQRRVRSELRIE